MYYIILLALYLFRNNLSFNTFSIYLPEVKSCLMLLRKHKNTKKKNPKENKKSLRWTVKMRKKKAKYMS